jgi:hypothetical protein
MGADPSGERVGTRRRKVIVPAGVIALLLLLAGCSGSSGVRDSLLQASRSAAAAVHTGSAALDMLNRGRITQAVAQTAMIDMTKEIGSSVDQISQLKLSKPDDRALRDTVQDATAKGATAVLAGRDCLQLKISCQSAKDQLKQAADDLDKIVTQLRSTQ